MEELGFLMIFAAIGYLIGSVSFARIIFALKRPGEEPVLIRSVSSDGEVEIISHAIGATNVMMALGKKWGLTTMALDLLKAFIPMVLIRTFYPDESYHLLCGIFVLLGHLWPVWYRFQGGGGNSTALGMMLAASPIGLLVTQSIGMMIGMAVPAVTFLAGVGLSIPWFILTKGVFSHETYFALFMTFFYILGQVPEAVQYLRHMKAGHVFDMKLVITKMKHASKSETLENETEKKGNV